MNSHSASNGLEPGAHAGGAVGVAAEVVAGGVFLGVGRVDGELDLVLARALELDVVAVVRAVAGHHRHHVALDDLVRAGSLVSSYLTSRYGIQKPSGKAVGVVGQRVDVGFEMDVGLGRLAHVAFRLHVDGLQIDGGDLHAGDVLRRADGIFEGGGGDVAPDGGDSNETANGYKRMANLQRMNEIVFGWLADGWPAGWLWGQRESPCAIVSVAVGVQNIARNYLVRISLPCRVRRKR